ncbi:MAG: HAD family phosphatase [Candidatus Limnocylindrales bacterium]|nr:HAD family phosphatase [Candidatus Limnocylindrales bacterium]
MSASVANGADLALRPVDREWCMPTVRATAVVFDLGGVLIEWDPRRLYRQLFDDPAAMESFLSQVCTPAWNARLDAGRSWPEAIESLAREFPAKRDLILAYDARWEEMLGGAIEDTLKVLAELRDAGIPCYALSNWSAAKFALTRPRFPFLEWFEGIVISGDVGACKPDPAIYRALVERYRLTPSTTVFIDDAEPNVLVGADLGFRAIRFTGAPRLRADLRGLGLPLAAAPIG